MSLRERERCIWSEQEAIEIRGSKGRQDSREKTTRIPAAAEQKVKANKEKEEETRKETKEEKSKQRRMQKEKKLKEQEQLKQTDNLRDGIIREGREEQQVKQLHHVAPFLRSVVPASCAVRFV
jgi:cysteinyl-tRNA synthetase